MKLKEASDRFGRTAAICQRHLEKQGQLKAEWGKVDDATARSGITKNPLIAAANSRPVGPASATPQLAGENEPYFGSQRGHNKLQEFINSPEAEKSIRPISKAWSPFSTQTNYHDTNSSGRPPLVGEQEPYFGSQRGHNKLQEFINSPAAEKRPISKAWSPFSGTSGDKRSYGGQVLQNLKNPYGSLRELFGGSPNR